ncbi:MAG: peptidoglycan editing factor PgeF [Balneolaceae bacterium]|nr:MAG: peptidoglycan editing factor PgeF [Balneolaceae bacterium]
MRLKIIYPDIFKKIEGVTSLFTLANRGFGIDGKGLDLGLNSTNSKEELYSNLKSLSDQTGIDFSNLALVNQIHGTEINHVKRAGIYNDADGLITTTPNLAISIQVADCAAVLIADPVNYVAGAFHAGWRGAVAGIVPNGVRKMVDTGADPKKMHVYVSACISIEKFEVGEEVAHKFPNKFCDFTSYRKPHVDLKSFIRHQLLTAEIPEEQIEISQHCTFQNTDFYSYRRERENAGRMLGIIMLNKIINT